MPDKQANIPVEPEISPKTEKDYNAEIKRIVASYLETELNQKSERLSHKITQARLDDITDRRKLGKIFAKIAGTVPLVMLLILVFQLHLGFPEIGMNTENADNASPDSANMANWAKIVFISGSFLSFIVIYPVLIKGMFQQHKDEAEDSPVKEAIRLLREYRGGGEPPVS